MTRYLRWAWTELTRPRGPQRHRFYRIGRGSRAGVALLMVVTSILLMSILVTEIAHDATIRMRLAAHHRDDVKAESLARTGVQLYRLILMVSKQIGRNPMIMQFGEMAGINADSVWQMVPFFSTGLLRMVLVHGDGLKADDLAESEGGMSAEDEERSRQGKGARRNFLDFDGDFDARVIDENRFIFVGSLQATTLDELMMLPAAQQLLGLMNKEEHNSWLYKENIERLELVGNLVDWTDLDTVRLYQGGLEDSLYERLPNPYRPKNAPFDTLDEIRLVDGWHRDGVWQRFGQFLTIYGGGKVNVNTALQPVLRGLLMAYAEVPNEYQAELVLSQFMMLRGLPRQMGGFYASSPQDFIAVIQSLGMPLRPEAAAGITTESTTFRVTSVGTVGDSRVEIVAVFDFTNDPTGQVMYWSVK